jgi:3-hydroxyisobutyrate dehydrogenase-like beta-hydroxyacid dehydrogenase
MSVRIAVLGLGEAGGEIARDLVALGADVRGFDPLVEPPPGVGAAPVTPTPSATPTSC